MKRAPDTNSQAAHDAWLKSPPGTPAPALISGASPERPTHRNQGTHTTMKSSTALAPVPKELTKLPSPLKAALKRLEIDVEVSADGLSAEECFQQALKGVQSSFVRMVYAGWWFRRAKALAVGDRAWVETRAAQLGVGKDAIYDAMALSERSDALSSEAFERYAQLEYTKVSRCLRKFTPEDLNSLAAGEEVKGLTFDDLREKPVREIVEMVRQATDTQIADLRAAKARLEIQLETQHAQYQVLEQQLHGSKTTTSPWSPIARQVREESSQQSLVARDQLDRMAQLQALLTAPATADLLDPQSKEYVAAARTLWLNMHVVYVQCLDQMHRFVETFGDHCTLQSAKDISPLDPEAAASVYDAARYQIEAHAAAALARSTARGVEIKRRRGRPRTKPVVGRK